MCGIVGVIVPQPIDRDRLDSALSRLHKRGPDGRDVWWSSDGCVGLGQTRLAINDPQGGAQPLVSPESVTTVNGEFYDLGSEYQNQTDSRALPHYFQRHGMEGALQRLRGEFAFLLYDRLTKTLYAGRDRFGIKPLFWAKIKQEWWFASKASALWAAGLAPGWCEESFAHAAATQYPPSGESLFAGVHSLPPAHLLTLRDFTSRVGRYWQVPAWQQSESQSDPTAAISEELKKSVQLRLRPEAETGVLLSGGVDSASVLALASAEAKHRLTAYTVDFPGSSMGFSEAELAAKQAAFSGVRHRVIPLSSTEIVERLPEVIAQTEGLCVNGHIVGKWKLAQAVHEDGLKVVLSGEGADELFFGYRHFGRYFGTANQQDELANPAGLGILVTQNERGLPEHMPNFFQAKYSLGLKISSFLSLETQPTQAFERILDALPNRNSPLEHARDAWLETALRSYILEVLGDGTEMAHSVEGRPPFLDHRLWEVCAQTSLSQHDGTKNLLRAGMQGRVIDEILRRPKHPFMSPPLGEPLYDAFRSQLLESSHPYLDPVSGLKRLESIRHLPDNERWEWEPALLWLLSSYSLQRLWSS